MAFVSNYFLADLAGLSTAELWMGFDAWRWMFWIELIPASIFLVALFFIPESPRFLIASGQHDKGQQVLEKLYGANIGHEKVNEIESSLADDQHAPKLSDLIDHSVGKVRSIVWVGIGLAVFQQLVGINVVFYYGAVLWQAVGFSEADDRDDLERDG